VTVPDPSPSHQPSARVVMIGAGLLGHPGQLAAVDLDVELTVLAQAIDEPAVSAGASYLLGAHTDADALAAAAHLGEVVTFDHELVPGTLLRALEADGVVLRPGRRALGFAQDKLDARRDLGEAGFPVPAWAAVEGPGSVTDFAATHGWPVVLKARSGGYDGRGVLVLEGPQDVPVGLDWGGANRPAWLVEEHLDLVAELAVLVARGPSGEMATYPMIETTQVDGICRHLVTPASAVGPDVVSAAAVLGTAVVGHIGAVGICAVELFVVAGGRLLVNEVALRPHNSGHATIEANETSQFHQHLRAVLDWPLGPTALVAPAAAMVNVIGTDLCPDPTRNLPAALTVEGAHIHLYGKQSRPGRKIGHVTALASTTDAALDTARRAVDALLAE
jgi:5-(carboxyamino)imidazole ribonucleotide synthase